MYVMPAYPNSKSISSAPVNYTAYPFYILIAAHGDALRLQQTLHSLAACVMPDNYCELILIENGAKAGIEEVAAAAPERLHIRYLYNSLPSKSEALNVGLAHVQDPDAFIFFTDDDVSLAPELLETYAHAAKIHGPGHYFGGPVYPDWEVKPPDWLLPCLPGSAKGWQLQQGALLYAFLGFNWGVFLSDLKVTGSFDRRFGPGSPHGATGQETNMQVRMFRAGLVPIYLQNASVTHQVPLSRCNFLWVVQREFRSGVSAGVADVPFHSSSALLKGRAPANSPSGLVLTVKKTIRLVLGVNGPLELACRITCLLALYAGMAKGAFIKARIRAKTGDGAPNG